MQGDDETALGYQRPPVNRRFKKEKSGNASGRPKGSGNFSSLVEEVLNQPMRLKIDRRKVVVTGREALGMVIANRAAAGDVRIVQLLIRYGYFERTDEPKIIWMEESLKNL
jgi:hypothetical protein